MLDATVAGIDRLALISSNATAQPCNLAGGQRRRSRQSALFDGSHQLSALLGRPTTPMAVSVTQALPVRRRRPCEAFYHQPEAFVAAVATGWNSVALRTLFICAML